MYRTLNTTKGMIKLIPDVGIVSMIGAFIKRINNNIGLYYLL